VNSFPKLSYNCPIPWASLRGDERARFCEKCNHTIVNFSELTEAERLEILDKRGPGKLCITYYRRHSGEYVTPENPLTSEERSRIKQIGVAALSAGAMALAAGCMSNSTPPSTPTVPPTNSSASVARNLATSAGSQPIEAATPSILAKYDRNRNGILEANELAALTADQRSEGTVPNPFRVTTDVDQGYGVADRQTPEQTKAWIDRQIASEAKKKSVNPGAGSYSVTDWKEFWVRTIAELRNPRQIGGANPNAEEFARYIVSQRRKLRLPELPAAVPKQITPP
jgi:hypothetical protein